LSRDDWLTMLGFIFGTPIGPVIILAVLLLLLMVKG